MKRRIIKIISLLFIVLLVFEIYYFFKSSKINYIALGDSIVLGLNNYGEIDYSYTDYLKDYLNSNKNLAYYKKYAKQDNRIEDILEDIKYKMELKKDLRESNLVTISIGMRDLLDEKNVDNMVLDMDKCINEIRKYAKQKLIIIGYYNQESLLDIEKDKKFAYIDNKMMEISSKYNAKYIPLYELFKNNKNYLNNSKLPNLVGQKAIYNLILDYINEKNLH